MVRVFTIRCPKCGNKMKYLPNNLNDFSNKKKRCVYCGHTFNVHKNINESRILKIEKT